MAAIQLNQETLYDRFYSYLSELLQSYTKLSELLAKKLAAVASFDVSALDNIIKEEQVYVLLARGFDNNLRAYREKLALDGDSLSVVIPQMPDAQQARFESVFHRLKHRLDEVKALNENCQELIEERIYSLEKAIRGLDQSKATGATYSGKAVSPKPSRSSDPHFLHKQI